MGVRHRCSSGSCWHSTCIEGAWRARLHSDGSVCLRSSSDATTGSSVQSGAECPGHGVVWLMLLCDRCSLMTPARQRLEVAGANKKKTFSVAFWPLAFSRAHKMQSLLTHERAAE